MLKIGITGGIGSGKSTIAKIFEVIGIPIYNADDAAKRLMNEKEELKNQILLHFGNESYNQGILNKKYIASIVFNDPEKLALLNSLVHPVTINDADEWIQKQTSPYIIKEAALFFESGAHAHVDQIIGVFTPAPLRILRVMKRDNITRDEVLARMNKQIDEEIKMRLCDHVITNNEQELVLPQVMKLHTLFLEQAKLS
jgi:dephospho-CoA kinase